MKAKYRKNFVDINFYGMQSKIQNPMANPEWRDTYPIQNAERERKLKALEEEKKKLKLSKVEHLLPAQA